MGFFDKAIGSISDSFGGILGSVGGSAVSGMMASSAADKAYDRQKDFYRNRHQWEIEDLKKAGLNPILSAMGSPGTAPSVSKADVPDYSKSMSSALQVAQIKNVNAQTELTKVKTTKEGVTKPLYEEARQLIELILPKLKQYFGANANSGVTVSSPPPLKSTKIADSIARPGSALHKVVEKLLQGTPVPVQTTGTGSPVPRYVEKPWRHPKPKTSYYDYDKKTKTTKKKRPQRPKYGPYDDQHRYMNR